MIVKLDSKPKKILDLESKHQLKFDSVGLIRINIDSGFSDRIVFKDLEEFYVKLDRIKIDPENIFESEDALLFAHLLLNKNLTHLLLLSTDKKETIIFTATLE